MNKTTKIYVNKKPPIKTIISPKSPLIKRNFDIIDIITKENPILMNYNKQLKDLVQEHHKVFYNYSRCRLEKGDCVKIEHIVLMDGIIARSLNIFESLLREFKERNLFAFHCLLRAHIETLSLVHYINKNPDYIKNAVNGMKDDKKYPLVNILTMLRHANKKYDGLEKNYNILSECAHPNAASLRTNLNIDLPHKIQLKSHIGNIPEQQALTDIDLFVKWTEYIFQELELLHEKMLEMEKNDNI